MDFLPERNGPYCPYTVVGAVQFKNGPRGPGPYGPYMDFLRDTYGLSGFCFQNLWTVQSIYDLERRKNMSGISKIMFVVDVVFKLSYLQLSRAQNQKSRKTNHKTYRILHFYRAPGPGLLYPPLLRRPKTN